MELTGWPGTTRLTLGLRTTPASPWRRLRRLRGCAKAGSVTRSWYTGRSPYGGPYGSW